MKISELGKHFENLETLARKHDAALEMTIGRRESFSAGYQQKQLKKYSADTAVSASFRVLYGKGTGVSTTEKISPDSLQEAFEEALRSAKDLSKAKSETDLAPELFKGPEPKEMRELFYSDYTEIPVSEKLNWAAALEAAALDFDPRIGHVPYSGFSNSSWTGILMNSKGVNLTTHSSSLSAYSYSLAKQGDDAKTGSHGVFTRSPLALDPSSVAVQSAQKALDMLGATQPKTGTWTVVLSNEVAAELMSLAVAHFSAKALDEGTSLLKDKKGETVFSPLLTWVDDPFRIQLPGARPYDSEGAASQMTPLVSKGVLQNYLTNSFYARKLNLPHTASAVRGSGELDVGESNLIIDRGTAGLAELLNADQNVIFITEVTALHSGYKDTTADFSLPSSGFLYRGGERVGPVHQFVFSGNLLTLLKNVSMISNRWNDTGDSVLAPDLLIPEASIAGG